MPTIVDATHPPRRRRQGTRLVVHEDEFEHLAADAARQREGHEAHVDARRHRRGQLHGDAERLGVGVLVDVRFHRLFAVSVRRGGRLLLTERKTDRSSFASRTSTTGPPPCMVKRKMHGG